MVDIYTDGSCSPNPGRGGWAFIAVNRDIEIYRKSGGDLETTNNRMEMMAVIQALDWLESDIPARIYSDSTLTVNVLSGFWKGKKNADLIEIGRGLLAKKSAEILWVQGHNGHQWNEAADVLAGEAAMNAEFAEPTLSKLLGESA